MRSLVSVSVFRVVFIQVYEQFTRLIIWFEAAAAVSWSDRKQAALNVYVNSFVHNEELRFQHIEAIYWTFCLFPTMHQNRFIDWSRSDSATKPGGANISQGKSTGGSAATCQRIKPESFTAHFGILQRKNRLPTLHEKPYIWLDWYYFKIKDVKICFQLGSNKLLITFLIKWELISH